MKLKKGDVYKEKSGRWWLKIIEYDKNALFELKIITNKKFYSVMFEEFILSQIQSGKLIKIPQLHK